MILVCESCATGRCAENCSSEVFRFRWSLTHMGTRGSLGLSGGSLVPLEDG